MEDMLNPRYMTH